MFLHIGDNSLIKFKDIIGVFDIDILKNSSENDLLFDKINEKDKNSKTLVIAENNHYFSNISVATIYKRLQNI